MIKELSTARPRDSFLADSAPGPCKPTFKDSCPSERPPRGPDDFTPFVDGCLSLFFGMESM